MNTFGKFYINPNIILKSYTEHQVKGKIEEQSIFFVISFDFTVNFSD